MTDDHSDDASGYFSDESATFGDRVSVGRRALGLSQDALSHKMGIKLKTLQSWENDISEPRANKLQMLAGILNLSLIWLLTGEGEGVDENWEQDVEDTDAAVVLGEIRAIETEVKLVASRIKRLERQLVGILRR